MPKIYVVKYALTKGIEEIERDVIKPRFRFANSMDYILYNISTVMYIGKEAFYTKEEAIRKAEELRQKKIASLYKQIEKMSSLKF